MCQYMAVAGAGAGADIMVEVGAENKEFRLRNTGFWDSMVRAGLKMFRQIRLDMTFSPWPIIAQPFRNNFPHNA